MAVAGKVAPVPKGEWAIGTSYNKIDIVTHNKDAYIALQNNIGQEPTRSGSVYWSLLMEHPGDNGYFVGTCSTGGSTAAKTVTISDNIVLTAGLVMMIKFTYANTATSPTLNINSTGAKSIYYNGAAITSSDLWTAGEADLYEIYVYDGTYWVWVGHSVNSGGVTEETVAPVEASPSTHAYTEGKQLYYEGVLYTVIDDIAIGDSLTIGTNIEASDDLVTQIANAGKGVNSDMTMEEYEALTPEQKADPDTYYWIGDAQGADYDNIRDIVSPTEYSEAVDNHAVGDEFILGDYLYKAISAIAQGDDIVTSGAGQNAELAGTIVEQLKALFDGEVKLKLKESLSDMNDATNYIGGVNDQGIRVFSCFNANHSPSGVSGQIGAVVCVYLYLSSSVTNILQIALFNSAIFYRGYINNAWDSTWKQLYGDNYYQKSLAGGDANSNSINIDKIDEAGGVKTGLSFCRAGTTQGTQPVSNGVYYMLLSFRDNATGNYNGVQMAYPHGQTIKMLMRTRLNNTWSEWTTIK